MRHHDLQDDDAVDDGGDDEQLAHVVIPGPQTSYGAPNPRSVIVDFVIVVVVLGFLFLAIPLLRNAQ